MTNVRCHVFAIIAVAGLCLNFEKAKRYRTKDKKEMVGSMKKTVIVIGLAKRLLLYWYAMKRAGR